MFFATITAMKYLEKISVRIAVALIVGFLIAGSNTSIKYDCPPIDGAMGCTAFEDAILHPGDLLNNEQNSLVRFSRTFAVSSVITFALISAVIIVKNNKSPNK